MRTHKHANLSADYRIRPGRRPPPAPPAAASDHVPPAHPPARDPPPPVVELVDREPPAIRRPLTLVAGHAYATTWLTVRTSYSEARSMGDIVHYDPPYVRTD